MNVKRFNTITGITLAALYAALIMWASVSMAHTVDRLDRLVNAHLVQGTAQLRPCDEDRPGHPVTGPCWLADDGTLAVWPYPYAPAPLYVLQGSQ